jgi:DNA-binding response OmpR family regulator
MQGLRTAALEMGAGFLEKPYDPVQLLQTIEQTLSPTVASAP